MPKYLTSLILLLFLAGPSWSQDDQSADETDAVSSAVEDESPEEILDDDDLDEQVYEEDEDDFVPTEEIPADEPIPFPSNI